MPHACLESPFGPLTVTATDEHIIALGWGRMSGASVSPLLEQALAQLDAYFAGRLRAFALALQPAGTPFLRRVWSAMTAVPFGQTVTYGALASSLGTGPRAIGLACRRNPLPILIPCHRVLAANGGLGGYSGGDGLATKQALLSLEGVSLALPKSGTD